MKPVLLGLGLVLPPAAWFASLEASFALAPLACASAGRGTLLFVSVVALSLAVVGGLLAWTQRQLNRRFALSGVALSALCTIVIAAQAVPNLLLGGCE